ncbi:MAG: hypothetical protein IT440_07935 [Phycisphaeraceae bacterium]|nr:hypothetical protein [Phycisphaeraceae bacterium]
MNIAVWMFAWTMAISVAAPAEQLVPIGVLGNSGQSGPTLLRVDPDTFGKGCSGVAADRDDTLWFGAGGNIHRASLNGSLIETIPLEPAGSWVESENLVFLGDSLYFMGRLPNQQRAMFAHAPGEPHATVKLANLPLYRLASLPLDGWLYAVATGDGVLQVDRWKPGEDKWEHAMAVPGDAACGIAVNPVQSRIYVGGRLFPDSQSAASNPFLGVTALTPQGQKVSDAFPFVCADLTKSMVPVRYSGRLFWAGGALWDATWHGFTTRLSPEGDPDPGTLEQWRHEWVLVNQITDLGDGTNKLTGVLACAGQAKGTIYLGHWLSTTKRVDWFRRIGCLPTITSLWLTSEGEVTVGSQTCQLWWRFEDAADALPRKAELHSAITPLTRRGDMGLSLSAEGGPGKPTTPIANTWKDMARHEATRLADDTPLKSPVGLTVKDPTADGTGWLYVSDADTRRIWRTKIWRPGLTLDNERWKTLDFVDAGLEAQFQTATDLAWLPGDNLLVAAEKQIVCLRPTDDGYALAWRLHQWGTDDQSRFGTRLRMCLDAGRLLVADTDRHRVLLFDLATRGLIAQFGQTDQPGDDLWHLNQPTLVSLAGDRAVVADAGNQRVMKLVIMLPHP